MQLYLLMEESNFYPVAKYMGKNTTNHTFGLEYKIIEQGHDYVRITTNNYDGSDSDYCDIFGKNEFLLNFESAVFERDKTVARKKRFRDSMKKKRKIRLYKDKCRSKEGLEYMLREKKISKMLNAKYGKCSCITCRKIMKPNDLRELEEISSRLKEYEEEVVS